MVKLQMFRPPGSAFARRGQASAEDPHCSQRYDAPQDLALQHLALANAALMKYKSCVRTTIRLCNGVECQEKDGVFMLAFLYARDAVEWAVILNTALLKCVLTSHKQWCSTSARQMLNTVA